MICGGAILLIAAVLTGELQRVRPGRRHRRDPRVGLLYLITVGSLVGFTTYVWLLRVAPLAKVATYAYVNPIVAVVLAGLLLGEPIEPRTALAGAVIVAGVALIVTARGRSQAARRPRRGDGRRAEDERSGRPAGPGAELSPR